ncbi:diacylglycerol/lipid kinase family protein [Pedobacter flavus]|uniref:Diacylglycerol kinase family protein n=1 Tax=Pedobacter flavus TaxID=3113906 RepID=A0ABU7H010_9SPHI|nr:diacylglycerol kinase family protein [Pedobacter sp. VNH31]MEE1884622.1 diacylglycerol kinase family protein [Pedobacter sp. VNH31]
MKTIKAYFIINPISGGKAKDHLKSLLNKELSQSFSEMEIVYTDYIKHAEELTRHAIAQNFDLIVAVGGDGTINEVAKNLVNTQVKFGIIPYGSGNGLARFLNIPLNTHKAIKNIKEGVCLKMDTGTLNAKSFFNMAGVGFDAKIGYLFSKTIKRGFSNYVKIVLREIYSLKPTSFKVIIDGQEYNERAFMISIANSSQYGNDMNIAKEASVTDGLFDVCIIKPFPKILLPYFGVLMAMNKLKTKYLKIICGEKILIQSEGSFFAHLDGEPIFIEKEVNIEVLPLSLNIIVPKQRV